MTTGCKSALDFVSPLVKELPKSGIRKFFDIVSEMKDAISLGVGEPAAVIRSHFSLGLLVHVHPIMQ